MWAQLITTRLQEGKGDEDLQRLFDQLEESEQPDSGRIRATAMRDDADPARVLMLVLFESEEAARAREGDPRREEGLATARATMAEIFDGPPEFTDLTVVTEG